MTRHRNWVSQNSKESCYYHEFSEDWGNCESNPRGDEFYGERFAEEYILAKPPISRRKSHQYLLSSTIPRRSTSLRSWARTIQIITQPSAPLTAFELTQEDGYWFQRLSQCTTRTSVQELVLQLCHIEPCIRHIALVTVMIGESFSIPEAATKHLFNAKRYLRIRLANINGKADLGTWELSLLAHFLFTKFQIQIGCKKNARKYMKTGIILFRSALRVFCSGNTDVELPGQLPKIAMAFGRLSIVIKST